jgi:hypothetical protein
VKCYQYIKDTLHVLLLIVLIAVGVQLYRTTLPKLNNNLDETHRAELETALTMSELRKFAVAENKALPMQQAKLDATLDNANRLIDAGTATLNTANATIAQLGAGDKQMTDQAVLAVAALKVTLDSIPPVLEETRKSVSGLQPIEVESTLTITKVGQTADATTAAINSPDAKQSQKNIADATGSLASTAADAQQYVHHMLHPKWPAQVGNWVERILVDVGKVFVQ